MPEEPNIRDLPDARREIRIVRDRMLKQYADGQDAPEPVERAIPALGFGYRRLVMRIDFGSLDPDFFCDEIFVKSASPDDCPRQRQDGEHDQEIRYRAEVGDLHGSAVPSVLPGSSTYLYCTPYRRAGLTVAFQKKWCTEL